MPGFLMRAAVAALVVMGTGAVAETLSRGTASEPSTLDPHVATGNSAAPILYDMFVGLTTFDFTGAIAPGAAESWRSATTGALTLSRCARTSSGPTVLRLRPRISSGLIDGC